MDQDTERSLQDRGFDVGVRCNERRKWAESFAFERAGGAEAREGAFPYSESAAGQISLQSSTTQPAFRQPPFFAPEKPTEAEALRMRCSSGLCRVVHMTPILFGCGRDDYTLGRQATAQRLIGYR